jgi:hypothetical protein
MRRILGPGQRDGRNGLPLMTLMEHGVLVNSKHPRWDRLPDETLSSPSRCAQLSRPIGSFALMSQAP